MVFYWQISSLSIEGFAVPNLVLLKIGPMDGNKNNL
ncbi:unnamed protein product [Larinioides sclopetarius]|uniref:Uncharacterized protein n=1 Tax=Larinioides sclopetarius TaxID=280406 RepID=A0AAV1Z8R2_9ARAC